MEHDVQVYVKKNDVNQDYVVCYSLLLGFYWKYLVLLAECNKRKDNICVCFSSLVNQVLGARAGAV